MDEPQPPAGGDLPRRSDLPVRLPIGLRPIVAPLADEPVITVSPAILQRYNARVLDPAAAPRVAGQPAPRSTVYLADKLLVSPVLADDARDVLTKAAGDLGLTIAPPVQERTVRRDALVAIARDAGNADADQAYPVLHHLEPAGGVAVPADAFAVLQTYRARLAPEHAGQQQVGLDHLLSAARDVHGGPFGGGPGVPAPVGSASYGQPGWGGRQPVTWLGGPPVRQEKLSCRRPVVAILDSGVGEHDWLPSGPQSCVQREVKVGSVALGLSGPAVSETTGVVSDPLEGVLDTYSGHGTFIAGLIRQQCPDADLISIRVMPSEGAVPEHILLEALTALGHRQTAAQAAGEAQNVVDVVSLSLGYYPEHEDATVAHPFLFDAVDTLSRCGVAVVVAAGNDATSRPMFPAAFAPHAGGLVSAPSADRVPVIGVGARNPDGTIALFSNAGPWVLCTERGAGVVSTLPPFDAGGGPAFHLGSPDGWRSTIDPDNFSSGFGVWSGTSFAAPVVAGRLAQALLSGSCGDVDALDAASAVARGWAAVHQVVGLPVPA